MNKDTSHSTKIWKAESAGSKSVKMWEVASDFTVTYKARLATETREKSCRNMEGILLAS